MSDRPDGWPQRGVHRVLGPAASVATALAGRGWEVALVPSSTTDAGLWDGLADALALPGWFGRNLDALDEALSEREAATALVLASWTAYARARPERWERLLHLLEDWAGSADRWRLVLLTD